MLTSLIVASLLANAAPMTDACAYDSKGVAIHTVQKYTPYTVKGSTVQTANAYLYQMQKPYDQDLRAGNANAAPSGENVGWFRYQWQGVLALEKTASGSTNERVAKACLRTTFTTFGPEFSDPKMAICFGHMREKIALHEARHVAITQAVIAKFSSQLIGLSPQAASAKLGQLDTAISAANDAFHQSDAGRPLIASDFPKAGCAPVNSTSGNNAAPQGPTKTTLQWKKTIARSLPYGQ